MSLLISAEPIPIQMDADGVARVGGTRVTLQSVIDAFNRGASAEEIVAQYPTVSLSDMYMIIGYYLQHQAEIDDYIHQQKAENEALRREYETQFGISPLQEKLRRIMEAKRQEK